MPLKPAPPYSMILRLDQGMKAPPCAANHARATDSSVARLDFVEQRAFEALATLERLVLELIAVQRSDAPSEPWRHSNVSRSHRGD